VPYSIFDEIFPPGHTSDQAHEDAHKLAQRAGCRIEHKSEAQTIWFVKDGQHT
jgi:hypothetical protein